MTDRYDVSAELFPFVLQMTMEITNYDKIAAMAIVKQIFSIEFEI